MYRDFKKLHTKTGHGSFVKLKALTAPRKWEPSFEESLGLILKKCKICTHRTDIIDTEVTHASKYGPMYGNCHILFSLGCRTTW